MFASPLAALPPRYFAQFSRVHTELPARNLSVALNPGTLSAMPHQAVPQ
jgi:hypothetical protein